MRRPAPWVAVEWIDSGAMLGNDQWTSTSSIVRNAHVGPVLTVGQLLKMDDEVAVVGLSYDKEYDNWFSTQVIARENIIKVSHLRTRTEYEKADLDKVPKGMVDVTVDV